MAKISVKYAISCGIFLSVVYHVSYCLGSNPLIDVRHLTLDLILFALFIFFAEKEFKIYHNNGIMHFWQGMTISFLVYGMATMLFSSFLYLYLYFQPDAVINYKEAATGFLNERANLYETQFGADGLQAQHEQIKNITMWDLISGAGIKKMLCGFFIAPIVSIILRKQPK